ncbi:DndE family protein [Mollicutes bacterium LVI A0039]|nr:DndE family protein [Mollicutes bacterium LVI A0039]
MRIKTTKEVLELLPDTTKQLGFSSNAETLKLALDFGLNEYPQAKQLKVKSVKQDGFEIDTHILFGDQLDYYLELLKYYYAVDKLEAKHFCILIDCGFTILNANLRKSKYSKSKVTKLILSSLEG